MGIEIDAGGNTTTSSDYYIMMLCVRMAPQRSSETVTLSGIWQHAHNVQAVAPQPCARVSFRSLHKVPRIPARPSSPPRPAF